MASWLRYFSSCCDCFSENLGGREIITSDDMTQRPYKAVSTGGNCYNSSSRIEGFG